MSYTESKDRGYVNVVVFLDLKKAFDTDANLLIKNQAGTIWKLDVKNLRPRWSISTLYGLTSNYLSSTFIQRSNMITSYNLRNFENKLAIPLPRTIMDTVVQSVPLEQSALICQASNISN